MKAGDRITTHAWDFHQPTPRKVPTTGVVESVHTGPSTGAWVLVTLADGRRTGRKAEDCYPSGPVQEGDRLVLSVNAGPNLTVHRHGLVTSRPYRAVPAGGAAVPCRQPIWLFDISWDGLPATPGMWPFPGLTEFVRAEYRV